MRIKNPKKRAEFRTFDSMAAAAGALGIGKEVLQLAKQSKSCKAFAGSRVREKELLEWMAAQPVEVKTQLSLKDQKLAEEIRKLRIRNDREEGRLLLASSVGPALRNLALNQRLALKRILENELPERIANKAVPQIIEQMRKAADQICNVFREGARAWMQNAPKGKQ